MVLMQESVWSLKEKTTIIGVPTFELTASTKHLK